MTTYYGTEAGGLIYATERGRLPEWSEVEDPEAALLVASEYIDANYGLLFGGWKTGGRAQDRQWPRVNAYVNDGSLNWPLLPSDVVPDEVERATYELAMRVGNGTVLTVDFNAAGSFKKAAVEGAVSVEFWGSGTAADAQTVFPIVTAILSPLFTGAGAGFSSLSGSRERV